MCLENLTTGLYFTSDDYLYHKKCFSKLNFKSPISRQDFSYSVPVNRLVNDKVYFGKKNIKNKFRIIYNLDGFDEDGFNKQGFDRNGFNRKGIDEYGRNLKDDDDIFKLAFPQNQEILRYPSERLRKINIQS